MKKEHKCWYILHVHKMRRSAYALFCKKNSFFTNLLTYLKYFFGYADVSSFLKILKKENYKIIKTILLVIYMSVTS